MLDLFLSICLYLHPGLAPLLLSADFFKSSTRPLQPAQSGRLCRDQRSVAIMHGQSCFFFFFSSMHTQSCTHTHSSQPCLCLSVPSRSLQSMDDAQDIPPPPPSLPLPLLCVTRGFEALRNLTEKIRPWTDLPKADVPFSRHQDHRHKDLH